MSVTFSTPNPAATANPFCEKRKEQAMARYRNCCFTLNNPTDMIVFDHETMVYLIYQEEQPAGGTYHFQGYCEFKTAMSLNPAKACLGGPTVHLEPRRGTQAQAIAYCKKEDSRVPYTVPYEEGEARQQGKRVDLDTFKDAVMSGANQRELLDAHLPILARYPRLYTTLTHMARPSRVTDLTVTLHIGDTGLGKTRAVMDECGDDPSFYRTPLTNGSLWFDGYDRHATVLIDDFAGAASKLTLCTLLQLLDRYPLSVPTKGGHTWWMPNAVHVTTNLLPKLWYKWSERGEQYKALARRFHKVYLYYVPLSGTDCGRIEQDPIWWQENKPDEAVY